MTQTIELDCAPGTPRPDHYLPMLLVDTGLEVREPVCKLFGMWIWDYSDVPTEHWKRAQELLAERIGWLHDAGCIRYGSW
jgi:hypothetical protein